MGLWFSRNHVAQKYGEERPRVPDLPSAQTAVFRRDDGMWLFERRWLPEGPCKATLLLIHGTSDHSGCYHKLGVALARLGVAVFAPDMRGWGLSDGQSLYFADEQQVLRDIEAVQGELVDAYPNVGVRLLMGKSIGGLLTAMALVKRPDLHFTGLIGLSGAYHPGPGVGVPSAPVMAILKLLAIFFPKMPLKPVISDHRHIVSDAKALKEWENDSLVSRGKMRLGYGLLSLNWIAQLAKSISKISVPILMLWGTGDKVVSRSGHEMMVNQSSSADTTLITYEGGFHNLLDEPALKSKVIADVCEWIERRFE